MLPLSVLGRPGNNPNSIFWTLLVQRPSPHISRVARFEENAAAKSVFSSRHDDRRFLRGDYGAEWAAEVLQETEGNLFFRYPAARRHGSASPSSRSFDFQYGFETAFRSAAQIRPHLLIKVLPGITGGHRYPDFAHRHPDLRADLQQLRTNGRDLRLRQRCCF
jgi:hypothetical protein